MSIPPLSAFKSSFFGLALCDALGTTAEFQARGSFKPITTMRGAGPFDLFPGQWTDDTTMALCLAQSLCESNSFSLSNQLSKYCKWYQEGHFSPTGILFDIGMTTRKALNNFEKKKSPYSSSSAPSASGNGSLMRLIPVPLYFSAEDQLIDCIVYCGESSRTTHGSLLAIDSCRFYGSLIFQALRAKDKQTVLSSIKWRKRTPEEVEQINQFLKERENSKESDSFDDLKWSQEFALCEEVWNIAEGSYKKKQKDDLKVTGFVLDSLETSLWGFYHSTSFEQGALEVVNLGGDADTIGAIYGQLAGAFYDPFSQISENTSCDRDYNTLPNPNFVEWLQFCSFNPLIELMSQQIHSCVQFNFQQRKDPTSVKENDWRLPGFVEFIIEFERFEQLYRSEIKRSVLPGPRRVSNYQEFDEKVSKFAKQLNYQHQKDDDDDNNNNYQSLSNIQKLFRQFFKTQILSDRKSLERFFGKY